MINHSITGITFLKWRKKMISKGGSKTDFDWLLDVAGGLSWSKLQSLIVNPELCFSLDIPIQDLEVIWESHLQCQTPLQYLISKCPWRDFELEVSPQALIPRQETEFLIEFALEKVSSIKNGMWADLGTGSGPLAISLSRSLPNWRGHAVDISNDALQLAKRNLKKLAPNANVRLSLGDWWKPLQHWWGCFDLVVSNPPYIPSNLIADLEPIVKDHEPLLALDGGKDGMSASKKIIIGSLNGLSEGGWLILEHHYDQSEEIIKFMEQIGMKNVSYEKDLNGIKRYAICCKK